MRPPNDDIARWLASELREDETGAVNAFASAIGQLPRVEPSPTFGDRLDVIVRTYCGRRRHAVGWARAAAALVILSAGSAIAMITLGYLGAPLVEASAALVLQAAVRLAGLARAGFEWWAFIGRVTEDLRLVLAQPQTLAVLGAVEIVGFVAALALRRILAPTSSDGSQWRQAYGA